jgi:hypothetical protein
MKRPLLRREVLSRGKSFTYNELVKVTYWRPFISTEVPIIDRYDLRIEKVHHLFGSIGIDTIPQEVHHV